MPDVIQPIYLKDALPIRLYFKNNTATKDTGKRFLTSDLAEAYARLNLNGFANIDASKNLIFDRFIILDTLTNISLEYITSPVVPSFPSFPYKVYTAQFVENSVNNYGVWTLYNTIGSIACYYSGTVGEFNITSSGLFTQYLTKFNNEQLIDVFTNGTPNTYGYNLVKLVWISSSMIKLYTYKYNESYENKLVKQNGIFTIPYTFSIELYTSRV